MAVEWCEHDPILRVVTIDGNMVNLHVMVEVPDNKESRAIYHEWHKNKAGNCYADGLGNIVVRNLACPFRTWAEQRHPNPPKTYGDRAHEYSANETATIDVSGVRGKAKR